MNHDYTHCADFNEDCPKECFRAQLVMDLKEHPQAWVTFGHLRGTDDCLLSEDEVSD